MTDRPVRDAAYWEQRPGAFGRLAAGVAPGGS
jgi:hypothetical protein